MEHYEVALKTRSETISGADCYQQEGPMTTFFRFGKDRNRVDPWSKRVASYRTAEIFAIRIVSGYNSIESSDSQVLEVVA